MFGNMLQYILDYGKDDMPYFSSHRERAVYDQIRQEINLESASGFYGLDEAKEVWDYALARYEEQQSICACFRARIERSNRINELINGSLLILLIFDILLAKISSFLELLKILL